MIKKDRAQAEGNKVDSIILESKEYSNLLALSESDIRFISAKDISRVLVAVKKTKNHSLFFSALLEAVPEVMQYLATNIVDGVAIDKSTDLIISHASQPTHSNARSAARYSLVFLVNSGQLEIGQLSEELQSEILPIRRAEELITNIQGGSSKIRKHTTLFLEANLEDQKEMSESICSDVDKFKHTIYAIYKKLNSTESSVKEKISAYQGLILLKQTIVEHIKDSPEEGLQIILSAPGLSEDLVQELVSLDFFRGDHVSGLLRAGLQSAYYRDEIINIFAFAAVHASENSAIRAHLFDMIDKGELDQAEFCGKLSLKYGQRTADQFIETIQT